jgi:hypothetical protein
MSDSNRQSLYYYKKSAFGAALPTDTPWKNARYTSEDLKFEPTTVESQELRADRLVDDEVRVSFRNAGPVVTEFSADSHDDWLASLLHAVSWSANPAVTATGTVYSMASGDNSFNRSSGSFISDGLSATTDVGKWISFSGFTGDTTNNTRFKIVSVAATKIVLSHGTVVADAAGESVTWARGAYIKVGTTRDHYALARIYNDLGSGGSEPTALFDDCTIASANLRVQAGTILNTTFQWLGREESTVTKATTSAGTPTYSVSDGDGNAIVSTVNGVPRVWIAGSVFPIYSMNFAIDNRVQENLIVGTEGIDSFTSGSCSITMDLEAYLGASNLTEYAKLTSDTASALAFELNGSGNYYLIDMPKTKYTTGGRAGQGKDTQTYLRLSARALRLAAEDSALTITKF